MEVGPLPASANLNTINAFYININIAIMTEYLAQMLIHKFP